MAETVPVIESSEVARLGDIVYTQADINALVAQMIQVLPHITHAFVISWLNECNNTLTKTIPALQEGSGKTSAIRRGFRK